MFLMDTEVAGRPELIPGPPGSRRRDGPAAARPHHRAGGAAGRRSETPGKPSGL